MARHLPNADGTSFAKYRLPMQRCPALVAGQGGPIRNVAEYSIARPRRAIAEPLEGRRLLTSAPPLAVNFNDEALWGSNFATAVQDAKALGITAVRLWYGFDYYSARPHAWDAVPAFGAGNSRRVDPDGLVMQRAFQLHQLGFSVMLVLQQSQGIPPKSPELVRQMVRYLMNATQTPTSKVTLSQAVDYWEIGNEPDTAGYWQPSGANKTDGLKSYVDNFLLPAAQELHADPAHPANVVSAGVSYDPADLKTILDELAAQHALADIDYAGFHAYGTYDINNPDAPGGMKANAELAEKYADAAGKHLMATEWNVRGFGRTGAQLAAWGQAMDAAYHTVIAPNFAGAYYFALVNNWAARGGTISARPGGLLMHDTAARVTPDSPAAALTDYYNAPLVKSIPFYDTFASWRDPDTAIITGRLWTDVNGDGVFDQGDTYAANRIVFIDLNGDGILDAGDRETLTRADGRYAFAGLAAGNYRVSHKFLPGYHLTRSVLQYVAVELSAGKTMDGVNIGATAAR